ncbi:MAG TPA: hypothetical protein VIM10_02515 [Actinopolymorphaceae bacterium]|jgi:hypothetical protein
MAIHHPTGRRIRIDPRNAITSAAIVAIVAIGVLVPQLSAGWSHSMALRVTVGALAGVIALTALASRLVARHLSR